ncbi:type II toxin-antitoxin system RelE/ParE family toxin [Leucothrix pacifica]|uniref:Plasmid stabilization protein n=1 Tax=Leucothrix pacifica TaxID=1247513 RepID=A0A317C435_9GAMM|nr:type II toxin-antitoxin system RelE/ParE family toxin [Leucothrix pacifica]PWQ92133.1 plasmid stabilization protein [Leucothrix pacifica]
MASYQVLNTASYRIDEIYLYSWDQWGEAQAKRYIQGLFDCIEKIAKREVLWKVIPAEYEVSGYYTHYEKHFVYWRELSDGSVGIATILHQSMSIGDRLLEDL